MVWNKLISNGLFYIIKNSAFNAWAPTADEK